MMGRGASLETEVAQGKALVDAAIANRVKFFVYSGCDRGGDKSFDTPTPIGHFTTKYEIEHYLVEKAKGEMEWTILRPVAFMEVRNIPKMLNSF